MKFKIFLFSFCFFILFSINFNKNDKIVGYSKPINQNSIAMPIVSDRYKVRDLWGAPQAKRDSQYARFLSASVKISVNEGSGSGTLVYYDSQKNEAYVASCGHLWSGSKSYSELSENPETCQITVWYHNETKLKNPINYSANVLFWSNKRGYDCSLIKFKPDWKPNFFPFAKVNYPLSKGIRFNSCGCDAGSEVALYDVYFEEFRGNDIITMKNSPRPGRSGGGLLTDDGYYVGTCWGTSDVDGSGIGYFTPLKSIYAIYQENNFGWILNVSSNILARKIPIRDINNKQGKYSSEYIPAPGNFNIVP